MADLDPDSPGTGPASNRSKHRSLTRALRHGGVSLFLFLRSTVEGSTLVYQPDSHAPLPPGRATKRRTERQAVQAVLSLVKQIQVPPVSPQHHNQCLPRG
ncbi:hypothetical protein EYF80_012519 [Liparis tanakae]|uniref:Uncharacterized protein n=1 Tax=Liparis tanakae TaxID=230148 RepID=A0A4Z2IIW7_9TELE|nr:hypothetical protein EYF80_012519 [Liparis tanakae]